MGAFAQFERELLRERQREGIEIAKKAGVHRGAAAYPLSRKSRGVAPPDREGARRRLLLHESSGLIAPPSIGI